MELKTRQSLLEKFKNPEKCDYESIAVSLIKNFSIRKKEVDSAGVKDVKYRIADLEIYLYSADDTAAVQDVATLNRDCIEGQWFFHRYGVDVAFRTIHIENDELRKFGGVLIRGVEKYENGKHVGNISGCQRCMLDIFNATDSLPELIADEPLSDIEVFNGKRVESDPKPYRYFKGGVEWEKNRKLIYQTQKNINGQTEYHIWHKEKPLTKEYLENIPNENEAIKKVYPL